jgi:glycosyltransferase involved in cell wall biosynthesis
LTAQELRGIRHRARTVGVRQALVDRTAQVLHLSEFAQQAELAATDRRIHSLATDTQVGEVHRSQLQGELHRARAELDAVRQEVQSVRSDLVHQERARAIAALQGRVLPVTGWVRQVELPLDAPSISVILPTYNRADRLVRAVGSVLAQEHANWQLVVVDDGSDDGTPGVRNQVGDDDRIIWLRNEHAGVSRARNVGLEAATGDIIAYLDDDNTMDPWWLKGVAWAFTHNPDVDVLFGGRVMDEPRIGDTQLPVLQLEPWDRGAILVDNYVDMGTIAHRRGLAEAHFDETLGGWVDYDMFLRLTEHRTPLALPMIASYYTSDAPGRISLSDAPDAAAPIVRARWLAPRILAYNALYPLVSETYIGAEMQALVDAGMPLAWCTYDPMDSPVSLDEPWYLDLDRAVAEFDPDLLFLYWASFAHRELSRLEHLDRPFALRAHSFDFDPGIIEVVRDHPLCIGVWAYPHLAGAVGAHPMPTLITRPDEFPVPVADRRTVLSMSAGLPKKDWPTLVAAFGQLAAEGAECHIVMGRTQDYEDEVDRVRAIADELGADITISVNVPHRDVMELLGRTALVVHTRTPGGIFGQPRSIVEGLCAGCSVVVPDRPEVEMAGPRARRYRTADDIVAHGREVLAGGEQIVEEWEDNRKWGLSRYAATDLAERFVDEVKLALIRHRIAH